VVKTKWMLSIAAIIGLGALGLLWFTGTRQHDGEPPLSSPPPAHQLPRNSLPAKPCSSPIVPSAMGRQPTVQPRGHRFCQGFMPRIIMAI
jgi:hypothetical protein